MADTNGLVPGDTGYDPSSDPYWGIAYGNGTAGVMYDPYDQTQPQSEAPPDPQQASQAPMNPVEQPGPVIPNAGPTPPPASGGGSAAFDGSLAGFQAALAAAGWPSSEDANYWYTRFQQTGGNTPTNLAYWQQRIAAGPAGSQPGGQYYEGGGAAGTSPPSTPAAALQQLPVSNLNLPGFKQAPAFQPTTIADMLSDPSYEFRMQQGENQLQQAAAARGVLNSGGTLKDIVDYGQNAASQEFANVDARRRQDYQTNYQTQYIDPFTYAYQGAKDAFSLPNNTALSAFSTIWNPALQISGSY